MPGQKKKKTKEKVDRVKHWDLVWLSQEQVVGTESKEQGGYKASRSGKMNMLIMADIRPIFMLKSPMNEVTDDCLKSKYLLPGQQHTEQPEFNNEERLTRMLNNVMTHGFKEFKSDKQAMTSDHNSSELKIHDHTNEPSTSKLVPKVVPPADKTATSQ
ncbi:hypothetical protein Tco_0299068 [Tanacetum coccineum]